MDIRCGRSVFYAVCTEVERPHCAFSMEAGDQTESTTKKEVNIADATAECPESVPVEKEEEVSIANVTAQCLASVPQEEEEEVNIANATAQCLASVPQEEENEEPRTFRDRLSNVKHLITPKHKSYKVEALELEKRLKTTPYARGRHSIDGALSPEQIAMLTGKCHNANHGKRNTSTTRFAKGFKKNKRDHVDTQNPEDTYCANSIEPVGDFFVDCGPQKSTRYTRRCSVDSALSAAQVALLGEKNRKANQGKRSFLSSVASALQISALSKKLSRSQLLEVNQETSPDGMDQSDGNLEKGAQTPMPARRNRRGHSIDCALSADQLAMLTEKSRKTNHGKLRLLSNHTSSVQLAAFGKKMKGAENQEEPEHDGTDHLISSSRSQPRRGSLSQDIKAIFHRFRERNERRHARVQLKLSKDGGEDCVMSVLLELLASHELADIDVEVQRLDLSEMQAEMARFKQGESNDHISTMDEQTTLSRIEKLFPNDDLDLVSPTNKKTRRRRSAPSQILLKNFRRSTTSIGDGIAPEYVSRKFINESAVQLRTGLQTQERYLFLFNDVLFIAKQRSATSYKLKNRVLVSEMWIGDNVTEVSDLSDLDSSRSFVIGWPTTNYVATFATPELSMRWKENLSLQIDEEQSKEGDTIEVEVRNSMFDPPTNQKLTVDKQTDTRALLQRVLQLSNTKYERESDFQLWLVSTKEDTVYPLFGHEQPFAIQLSHTREAEEMDANIKCHFVLRETKKTMAKLADRKPAKSKKKKLVISDIFRRSSSKLSASPRSSSLVEGKLFGHPLSEICDPFLPKPLMDLLEHLYNIGPFTTEIFRKPPNARSCQDMVRRLNSNEPEGWDADCRSGILFASILKKFLKELPDTLCCCARYNDWANAMNSTSSAERIAQCQRLIEQLPQCNQLLLKYIVCILVHIKKRSDDNLMTSYNLSVCLGPSLLWTSSSDPIEQSNASKLVPQVLQLFIDRCEDLFGKDIMNLFGHPPIPPEDSDQEDSQRLINAPYNDSLESLSDNDPALTGLQQMSPSSCSRDSGLILSDPHEDAGDQYSNRQMHHSILKSKSCDSLSRTDSLQRCKHSRLQTQFSSDSLDCDDEFTQIVPSFSNQLLLTKSQSGVHLCYDRKVESGPSERLRQNLTTLASRYQSTESPPMQHTKSCTSSDSDKSEHQVPRSRNSQNRGREQTFWAGDGPSLQNTSTRSSMNRDSTSSDDTVPSNLYERVTLRKIEAPRILESESGHHPTDFLHQFKVKQKNEEAHKKRVQQIVHQRTCADAQLYHSKSTADLPSMRFDQVDADSRDRTSYPTQQSSTSPLENTNLRSNHSLYSLSPKPPLTRTNTYAGHSDSKLNAAVDTNMWANKAEMQPILPQQYRPSQPPPYSEAIERMRSGILDIERIKQTVNSARAKQLYAQSLQKFEKEQASATPLPYERRHSDQEIPVTHSHSCSLYQNNNTILASNDKSASRNMAATSKTPAKTENHSSSANMFYQPIMSSQSRSAPVVNSLANSFYRPMCPPPYQDATRRRQSKPDLKDMGAESLV